jgi:hypothetical protein
VRGGLRQRSCAELCAVRSALPGRRRLRLGDRVHVGRDPNVAACPECVEHFGRRNPEWFPILAEYEEAARRYPEPILAGEEDMRRLDDNIFFDEVYEAATLSREELAPA